MTCAEFARTVDAYIDGELAAGDTALCDAHAASCAACGEMVSERLALSRALRAMPYYAAPASLKAALATRARRRGAGVPRFLAVAAAALLAVALGATGFSVRGARRHEAAVTALATRVADEHVRALAAAHLYDVRSSDQHTVKPWFLGKLDFSPPVVDLAAEGFPLAGGRVATIDGHTAATLVYERRLHPIEVFIWPAADGEVRPAARAIRGFHVRCWSAEGMAFWVVSDVNDAELDQFAAALRAAK